MSLSNFSTVRSCHICEEAALSPARSLNICITAHEKVLPARMVSRKVLKGHVEVCIFFRPLYSFISGLHLQPEVITVAAFDC